MKKYLLVITLLLSFFEGAKASHIVGGEIYYDYLGSNNYRITVTMYRDCLSSGAPFDDPMHLTIYDMSGVLIYNLDITFPGSVNLPVVFNNPCVTPPNDICVERAIYTTVVNLPPTANGYTASYQRCCRGPNVTNLVIPEDTGFTLTTHITGSNQAVVNNAPRFVNYPPLLLCNNDDLIFDHHAVDPDGDVLVYELITPNSGANSGVPQPDQAPPPPYAPVIWDSGFGAAQPLGPGSSITINSTTGLLVADPDMLGLFVVGIRVKEYRNGLLIGWTDRDFLFRVINCVITLESIITPQAELANFVDFCQGTTIQFENESYGGNSYSWDFGVSGTTTDVSSAFEPSYTFPGEGTYTVTLVVNPGWPCTDTSTEVFELYDNMTVSWSPPGPQCQQGNSYDFDGTVVGPSGTTATWDFGPDASIPTANTQDVSNVNFNTSGYVPITLTGDYASCHRVVLDSILVFQEPDADFTFPTSLECGNLTAVFTNTTSGGGTYAWDFGVPVIVTDVSTETSPEFTFPSSGSYDVLLVAEGAGGCTDSVMKIVQINDAMIVEIDSEDSLCITGNSFTFTATYEGPPGAVYSWNFGSQATPQNATGITVPDVVFSSTGNHIISFSSSLGNCSATELKNIFLIREPEIAFGIRPGTTCVPYLAEFIDSSNADTPLDYSWNFGDNTTSTLANPTHLYDTPGFYDVSLQIATTTGCVRTLNLDKPKFIHVYPKVVAGFDANPHQTDLCSPEVTITSHAQHASIYLYRTGEGEQVFTVPAPVFIYKEDGTKNVLQVVSNEGGCVDSARLTILIEPVPVYIPNTFTPDGNKFNNTFFPVSDFEMSDWEFRIYNKWGELIFESTDQTGSAWDGTHRGQPSQDGTYGYYLRYTSCDGKAIEMNGFVNLLR